MNRRDFLATSVLAPVMVSKDKADIYIEAATKFVNGLKTSPAEDEVLAEIESVLGIPEQAAWDFRMNIVVRSAIDFEGAKKHLDGDWK